MTQCCTWPSSLLCLEAPGILAIVMCMPETAFKKERKFFTRHDVKESGSDWFEFTHGVFGHFLERNCTNFRKCTVNSSHEKINRNSFVSNLACFYVFYLTRNRGRSKLNILAITFYLTKIESKHITSFMVKLDFLHYQALFQWCKCWDYFSWMYHICFVFSPAQLLTAKPSLLWARSKTT